MNEPVDTKVDPPAPATQTTSKAKRRIAALGWAAAGTVIPVGAAAGAGYVYLNSLPDDAEWSALSVLFIVPAVYLIVLFVIAGLGVARSRTLKDGAPRGTAVFVLPVVAIVAGVVLNVADGVQDSIERSDRQSGAENNALDDQTAFHEQPTPANVKLRELLVIAELPDSESLLYQSNTMNTLELCPNGTSQASNPWGRDGDIDGWLDAQAESLGEAGFETRQIVFGGRTLNDPNSTTHALLVVNGSAALILEAESREGFDVYHSQIIVGSCVEQLGLGLIDSISRFTENDYVEVLDE